MKKLLLLIAMLILSGCDSITTTYETETGYSFSDTSLSYDCRMGHTYTNFSGVDDGWQPMQNNEGAPMKCHVITTKG